MNPKQPSPAFLLPGSACLDLLPGILPEDHYSVLQNNAFTVDLFHNWTTINLFCVKTLHI